MSIAPPILQTLRTLHPDEEFSFSGGSRVTSSKGGLSYFVKSGSEAAYDQYHGEAESLKAMYAAAPGLCPKLIGFGELSPDSRRPFMVSEYKDLTPLTSASSARLAKRLALELHEPKNSMERARGRWGLGCPTYCGVTRLEHGWFESWEACFGELMKGLVDGIRGKGGCGRFEEVVRLGDETVAKVIPHLLSPTRLKDVEPVILHGDLWSGNVGTLSSGEPIIYDPASYYGHNEADLAIARMFGGFPSSFWSDYHTHRAKTAPVEEYDERQALYELFHYLNLTLVYGGGYASPSVSRMVRLLKFVEDHQTLR